MKIKLYYAEDHKTIMFEIDGKSSLAADLFMGLVLLKKEDIRDKFGPTIPTIELDGDVDEKLYDTKKEFDKIFDEVFTY